MRTAFDLSRAEWLGAFVRSTFFRWTAVCLLVAGCTNGIKDSSSLTGCSFPNTFNCTCASGGSGLAYCMPDGRIEDECRCDGSMPDFPDAAAPDGAVPDAAAPVSDGG